MAEVFIPEKITVHLGAPDSYASNVSVTFPDYIKNVASSEIYPTWSDNAIRANVYAQISFALNRVYTEYYRTLGYDFDITNVTAFDQAFINGREIFENISQTVDEIFNEYIRRIGSVEPLFAQYCNGVGSTCEGMSQWGSEELGKSGTPPIEILKTYYGSNIEIVRNTPVRGIRASYPYRTLTVGSVGDAVVSIQNRLNRISVNFPDIPKIANPNGFFGEDTRDSVKTFQKIFNLEQDGKVGKATWYRIQYVYNGIKQLNSIFSEGISPGEIEKQFPEYLALGSEGSGVYTVQYFLSVVSEYVDTVLRPPIDGYYNEVTAESVRSFQQTYGLVVDGIVGEQTYSALFDAYEGIINSDSYIYLSPHTKPYPGYNIIFGSTDPNVSEIQKYLLELSKAYDAIPEVEQTGVFGVSTRDALIAAQELFGLEPNGIIGALTWNTIANEYNDIIDGKLVNNMQYPGYVIG